MAVADANSRTLLPFRAFFTNPLDAKSSIRAYPICGLASATYEYVVLFFINTNKIITQFENTSSISVVNLKSGALSPMPRTDTNLEMTEGYFARKIC